MTFSLRIPSVMWLTSFVGVELKRTATPHSLTVLSAFLASKVAVVETNTRPSPASSITKLGIVKFSISGGPALPNKDARSAIKEPPSFSSEERPRPTVQMPPLADRAGSPESDDDEEADFDDEDFDDEALPAGHGRKRVSTLPGMGPMSVPSRSSSPALPIPACEHAPEPPAAKPAPEESPRRPARSWWHGALIGAAMMTMALCPFGLVPFA